jgi:CheY-like chemotaxis protein
MDWARRCVSLIQFKKTWIEKGRAPEEELAAKAIPEEDSMKLEEEVFNPKQAASAAAFDPARVEIKVFGSEKAKPKKVRGKAAATAAPCGEPAAPESHQATAEGAERVEAPVVHPSTEIPASTSGGPRKPTILIIDDYEPLLKMLCKALQGAGYEVCSAKDGVEGLVRLHENHVDLIVSDVQMPKLDGFDLSRMLNVRDSTREIPIIFLTEVLDEQTKAVAKRLGAADTLVKPFTRDALFDSVRAVLAGQRAMLSIPDRVPVTPAAPLFAVVD